jgi:hypothetical protein
MLDFSLLRPLPQYPKYPGNYVNTDEYLEQYFYNYYLTHHKNERLKRYYLPIFWTNLFVDNHKIDVQKYINAIDWSLPWFTVCQMDDGVRYQLPPNTLVFHAGGNTGNGMKIPIPLVASPFPEHYKSKKDKDILASFVGSMTHPIRAKLFQTFVNNADFYFNAPKQWSQSVSDDDLVNFINTTKRSHFTLSPAGYGFSSFRTYQAIELGSIPVYISDRQFWLPFEDELNWNEFCVLIHSNEIQDLPHILNGISDEKRKEMLAKGQEVWNSHFSLEKICQNIIKRL